MSKSVHALKKQIHREERKGQTGNSNKHTNRYRKIQKEYIGRAVRKDRKGRTGKEGQEWKGQERKGSKEGQEMKERKGRAGMER